MSPQTQVLHQLTCWVLLSFILTFVQAEYFNILAIDGGGIRGIIPGTCIDLMETEAYEYAQKMNYTLFPKYYDKNDKLIKKIPMKDLFNMMAGTSTGSILSAGLRGGHQWRGLSVKSDDPKKPNYPKYWASDAVNIYIDGGP